MDKRLFFMDRDHKVAYRELVEAGVQDERSQLVIYLLTAAPEIRDNFPYVYNEVTGGIRYKCWLQPWVTPTARLLITAALSLTSREEEFPIEVSRGTIWPVLLMAMDWRGRMTVRDKYTRFFKRRVSDR